MKADSTRRRSARLLLALSAALLLLAATAQFAAARSAFVPDYELDRVVKIDAGSSQPIGVPAETGTNSEPYSLAISPDGKTVWVVNYGTGTLDSIDAATGQLTGTPIAVPKNAYGFAIAPNGARAYLAVNGKNEVLVIDLQARQVIGSPILVGGLPAAIAISPDGTRAYVSNNGGGTLSVIDTSTNQVVGNPIPVGGDPYNLAFTPDGRTLFVANQEGYASAVDVATGNVGTPIPLGKDPSGIAISPNGARAYVSNYDDGTVSVIDTASRGVVGSPIAVGTDDEFLAVTPDGSRVLVASYEPALVNLIDTATNQLTGTPAVLGGGLGQVAVVPNQGPTASFAKPGGRVRPGVAAAFNAAASSDPDGSVAKFAWKFGKSKSTTKKKAIKHAFSKPGTYQVTLTVTDNEGCSATFVFTGQTASCNGSAAAIAKRKVVVAYPAIEVRCHAVLGASCRFQLQAFVRKHGKLKAASPVAGAKAKAGKSAIVRLKPKQAFAAQMASAAKVLVRETVTVAGATTSATKKLKIVG
jgi:YVTN family beta-propeller protein